jgi:hypothetical protein
MLKSNALIKMQSSPFFGGWGYLGHRNRTLKTDILLLEAANKLNFTNEDLFSWANSISARHFMDHNPTTIKSFLASILLDGVTHGNCM